MTLTGNRQPRFIRTEQFEAPKIDLSSIDSLSRHYAQASARGHAAAQCASDLARSGFIPDLILGHSGWGDTLFLRDVFPRARIQSYSEFYYRADGADVGFDPEWPAEDFRSRALTHTKNASILAGLFSADRGIAPTLWQRSVFPQEVQTKIDVAHDGIDTNLIKPNAKASISLKRDDIHLRCGDEVITFVNRNLEPYRGYHVLMRALPYILAERPKARVVIVGGDETSYGPAAPRGKSWRDIFLAEVQDRLDVSRVHFVGQLPYDLYLRLLAVSAAHVYLTYPFVLSWSMLEAMAMQCLVIGSDTPPVREVIEHGTNGILTPFFDIEALAKRVIDALAHPDDYKPMRLQARETIIARYDLHSYCLPRQLALLRDLMA
jgi:glycosyltransferase involved in cell wall biosynthesis